MRRVSSPASVLLAAGVLAFTGCNRAAVLELELELPASPETRYAVVQVRTDEGFGEPWDDQALDLEGIPLSASCARGLNPPACADRVLDPNCSVVISVIAEDDFERPIAARVRFCTDPRCGAAGDASAPEHRVRIERAFYLGRYTQARTCVDTLPTERTEETIDRCEVRCRGGVTGSHCRLDGTHFCEAAEDEI